MKILFITHYDNMYGANKALLELIKGVKRQKNISSILVIPCKGEMTKKMEELGVPYIISPITQWQAVYSDFLRFTIKKIVRKNRISKEIEYIYNNVKDEGIDIVYSNTSVICHGAVLADKMKCKHFWHIREFSKEHFGMIYFFPMNKVRYYYESATVLITISDSIKNNYIDKYPNATITRIYDGVDIDAYQQNEFNPPRYKKSRDVLKLIYVGYLFEKKHQLDVIKAIKKINEKTDRKLELYIVGDGSKKYRNKLEKYIKDNKIENVSLMGYRSDVNLLLQNMDVGIIASEYEGFGLVTVEYMLAALPVIGFNHSGTSEIVKNGKTGILYNDEDELVEAVLYMMNNAEDLITMGLNGKERAEKNFSSITSTKKIIELINKYSDN